MTLLRKPAHASVWRRAIVFAFMWVAGLHAAESRPFRVALIAGGVTTEVEGEKALAECRPWLEKSLGASVVLLTPGPAALEPPWPSLQTCDAVLLQGGAGGLSAAGVASLREFLRAGKGLVVVAAAPEPAPSWPEFAPEVLGARGQGRFANGYAIRVINLYPHDVYAGVPALDTRQPMPHFTDLAPDTRVIMEGTVGEAVTPLGWLRQLGTARVCSLVPGDAALMRDEAYVRLIGNALLWTAHRPIPGARALVQRTYLGDAFPGALAVTLPGGPAFCLDPVRGGISQIWDGDFVDLRPRWLTKQGEPARFGGEAFFREAGRASFWSGAGGDELACQFRGYDMAGEFPEFHYRIGDREVHEETRPAGSGVGLVRRFRVGPGTTPLWYRVEPQAGVDIITTGIQRDDRGLAFTAKNGGEFTLEIRRKIIVSP